MALSECEQSELMSIAVCTIIEWNETRVFYAHEVAVLTYHDSRNNSRSYRS